VGQIRATAGCRGLVESSYLAADLERNVERFRASPEFSTTLAWTKPHLSDRGRILEVGSGNGIAAVSFALEGLRVTATEPDPSATVGAGAVRWLKQRYALDNLEVRDCRAENLDVERGAYDVVYARQTMHHAADLGCFVKRCAHALRSGGLFITVRDHVVFDEDDKRRFLEQHPLHHLYGGENAFHPREYRAAMEHAGLRIVRELRYYDSALNYYPQTDADLKEQRRSELSERLRHLQRRLGPAAGFPPLVALYLAYRNHRTGPLLDERAVPGRLYSYLAVAP